MNCFYLINALLVLLEGNEYISIVTICFGPLILFNLPLTHFLKAMAQSNIRYISPKWWEGGWIVNGRGWD
ncbi:rCG50547, isoform CRA_a [Rattus norvegicus]|uniref:RCG50547, isoform CRA_a n=1 Tax=Rattus norvegicus TaxID=10116 RepID=A6KD03_RAT|nr:rCG50547, isoform CRA_a [Rattus norvegicus]